MSFPSTDLPKLEGDKERDTESIRKSVLDLLDKINKVSDQLDTLTTALSNFPTKYQSGVFKSGPDYIQYADGTLECWGTSQTSRTTSSGGPVFYASTGDAFAFPVPFISTPSVSGACNPISNSFQWSCVNNGTLSKTGVTMYLASISAGANGYNGYRAIGKWK